MELTYHPQSHPTAPWHASISDDEYLGEADGASCALANNHYTPDPANNSFHIASNGELMG